VIEGFDEMVKGANVLPLRYWDDPVLSAVCDKIEDNEFGPKLFEFGRELLATMKAKNGIGLAAPQVGVAKRMFAMTFPDNEDFPPCVMCNPELQLQGGTRPGREGCLSLPNVFEQVYRAEWALVRYFDPMGKEIEMPILKPFDARVAQHEDDHLNGIMFFDYKDRRPNPWGIRMTKNLSKGVLREWEKQKKIMEKRNG
jgi:peptide deformylase